MQYTMKYRHGPIEVYDRAVSYTHLGTTLEELLGIPTYETVLRMPEDAVLEASYLTLGDAEPTACIYLSCRLTPDGYTDRYWIDVKNQMLYRADAQFKDEQFYAVQQLSLIHI